MLVLLMAASMYGTWSCKSCMTSLLFFWKRSQPLRAAPLLEGSQGRLRSAQAKELWSVMLLPAHACNALQNGLMTTGGCFLQKPLQNGLMTTGECFLQKQLQNGLMTTGEWFLQKQVGWCSNTSSKLICTGTCTGTHTLIPRLTVCECSKYC